MSQDMADVRGTISLTPREAHEFLSRLATDDAFRARLETSPHEVLSEYHLSIPIEVFGNEFGIPSKEEMADTLQAFRERGEINLARMFTPTGWPLMVFWWLYMTPAKPHRRVTDETTADPDPEESDHLARIADVRITKSLSPRETFNLLLRMASDDSFRASIEHDPHGVLARFGIDVPSKDIPLQASLPPKDALRDVLLDIMADRQGAIAELPFNVDPMYWYFIDFLIFLLSGRGSRSRIAPSA